MYHPRLYTITVFPTADSGINTANIGSNTATAATIRPKKNVMAKKNATATKPEKIAVTQKNALGSKAKKYHAVADDAPKQMCPG